MTSLLSTRLRSCHHVLSFHRRRTGNDVVVVYPSPQLSSCFIISSSSSSQGSLSDDRNWSVSLTETICGTWTQQWPTSFWRWQWQSHLSARLEVAKKTYSPPLPPSPSPSFPFSLLSLPLPNPLGGVWGSAVNSCFSVARGYKRMCIIFWAEKRVCWQQNCFYLWQNEVPVCHTDPLRALDVHCFRTKCRYATPTHFEHWMSVVSEGSAGMPHRPTSSTGCPLSQNEVPVCHTDPLRALDVRCSRFWSSAVLPSKVYLLAAHAARQAQNCLT